MPGIAIRWGPYSGVHEHLSSARVRRGRKLIHRPAADFNPNAYHPVERLFSGQSLRSSKDLPGRDMSHRHDVHYRRYIIIVMIVMWA
jgi:hypothetical protein